MVVFSIMGSRALWNCGSNSGYSFRVTSSGSVQVQNHSDDNEPAQKADVFINGELVIDDADVPAMNAGTDWIEFAHIYPPAGNWEWRVKGESDCSDSGEHLSSTPPPPTDTEVPTATSDPSPTDRLTATPDPDPEPSATPDPEPTKKPTRTPDPEPSATDDDDDDPTRTPKPTRTKEPEDTETPDPTKTQKPTRTPDPEPTDTSRPDPTDTPRPQPDPTDTPKPQPEPSNTNIPAPTFTQKPPDASATFFPPTLASTATPPLEIGTQQQNFCSACNCPCACSCGAGASHQPIVVEVISEATNFDAFVEPAKVLVVGLIFFMAGGLGVAAFATYTFGGLGPRR